MRRMTMALIFAALIPLSLAACGGGGGGKAPAPLQPATFDASGTWVAKTSSHFSNPPGNEDQDETVQVVVIQTGNDVTIDVVGDAVTYTGTVSGATYTVSTIFVEPDGTTNETLVFTLLSADAGGGTLRWRFTGVGGPLTGGGDLSVARAVAPTFDMTGTWDLTTTGNFSNPSGNEEPNETVSVAVTQTGSVVQLTLDGVPHTGFVSGADYFAGYTVDEGGGAETEVRVAFTLSSANAGDGSISWRFENGSVITGGAAAGWVRP